MRDYWLSKLFFDLQDPAAVAELRADRDAVLDKYPLEPEVRKRVIANDVLWLSKRTNPYLLRYYFFAAGMKDEEFIRKLNGG
ncbi:MAG TPA: hypothetical protein VD965_10110 [Burkholderiales bacterium]|nr:hypothetical protein [Burkholderiales bacterium]